MSMSIPANDELGQSARQFSAISSQFSATAFWLLISDFDCSSPATARQFSGISSQSSATAFWLLTSDF
jgi:hypothetical protein